MPSGIEEDLRALEERVRRALDSGDETGLEILGRGEQCAVLGWRSGGEHLACKRLPPFPNPAAVDEYRHLFSEHLHRLAAAGVSPLESRLVPVPEPGESPVVYCVQPAVPAAELMPAILTGAEAATAAGWLERLVERVTTAFATDPELGLDAVVSNWLVSGGELRFLDVTTPMLRDSRGRSRLPPDQFLASLPWPLRWSVKHLLLERFLERFFEPRGALLDLLASLHKEGLSRLVPVGLEIVNRRLTPALTAAEVRRTYRLDCWLFDALQRLRRLDRAWQRRIRRRPYPFLLPGTVPRARVPAPPP